MAENEPKPAPLTPSELSALDFVMDRIGLTFTVTGDTRFDDRTIAAARAELLTLREENERLRRAVVERDRAIEKGVRHVCDSMRAWRDAMDDEGHDVRAVDETFRRIGKSALLDRLIYRCEPLRTEKCPAHKGRWSGIPSSDAECPHGCALTGWLPVKPAPEAPAG